MFTRRKTRDDPDLPREQASAPDSRPELLLVDDDRELRDLLALSLQERGFTVVTANNGQEALDRLRSAALPAAVLLDLNMPTMNGWQFCAAKNADSALKSLPVI